MIRARLRHVVRKRSLCSEIQSLKLSASKSSERCLRMCSADVTISYTLLFKNSRLCSTTCQANTAASACHIVHTVFPSCMIITCISKPWASAASHIPDKALLNTCLCRYSNLCHGKVAEPASVMIGVDQPLAWCSGSSPGSAACDTASRSAEARLGQRPGVWNFAVQERQCLKNHRHQSSLAESCKQYSSQVV